MNPAALTLVDLDQRPDLGQAVLALFAAAPPGADHLVCGLPAFMGLPIVLPVLGYATWHLYTRLVER